MDLRQPSADSVKCYRFGDYNPVAWHPSGNPLRRTASRSNGIVGGYYNRDQEEDDGGLDAVVCGHGGEHTRRISFKADAAVV